jgi:hypothetical protein
MKVEMEDNTLVSFFELYGFRSETFVTMSITDNGLEISPTPSKVELWLDNSKVGEICITDPNTLYMTRSQFEEFIPKVSTVIDSFEESNDYEAVVTVKILEREEI